MAPLIAPPKDVVKLEDRLFYVLQPPLESIFTGGTLDFPFTPFPYQFEGIAFLYPRYSAILADEMGLGKTMQITTIRLLLHAGEVRSNVLLICPKPLVTNWQREFATWAAELPIMIVEGDQAKRRWQWCETEAPVKIANYESVVRDRDLLESDGLRFDLVVLDESQRIKNRNGTTSEVVRSIRRNRSWAYHRHAGRKLHRRPGGHFRVLATGIPHARHEAAGHRSYGSRLHHSPHEGQSADRIAAEDVSRRRNRADAPSARNVSHGRGGGRAISLSAMGEGATIQNVFELVMRLKQVCNFDPLTGESAKLERLEADLEEVVANGRKALIFSQWVETLERLGERLEHLHPLYYHGKIPHKKRDGVIQEFKTDKNRSVLLMSYGTERRGLNLQFSQYVFLYDRWWNPAIEDQAINRAHRIGAAGPVTVTRFVAAETIEQRIDQLLPRNASCSTRSSTTPIRTAAQAVRRAA